MAKAYLGKISALVTANTSDFNSKLNASAKEVRSFAASMQSTLSRAETSATSSLRGIYTEAQKLERALKAASSVRLSFKGVETGSLDDASRRLQQLFSVTQSITKPLEASAKALAGLSAEVQASFIPALVRAQKNTESLTASINNNEKVSSSRFSRVKKIVDSLNDSLSRSAVLQQRASSVLGASRSIELRAPRVDAAVAAAASRVQEIKGLPAGARDTKEVQGIVASYEKAVQRLVALQGRLDAAVASGKNTARVTREIGKQAEAVDRLNELYNRLKIGILAPFDQITGQSQQAAAAFNALSSVSRSSIDSLKSAADAAVAAFENTGRGIDEARAAVSRFEAAIKAASAVDTIQSQMQSSSVAGGVSPLDLLAKTAQTAFAQFSSLSNSLKASLLPSLQEASSAAISLGTSVAAGADVGERKIQRLTQRLSDLSEKFKNLSSFSLDGLFAAPRDVRGIAQLNQSVVQLDQRFAGLSASSRSFLDPFTSQVLAAASAVRDAEIAEKPRREINKLVTAYRQAVKALESVLGQVERTQQAFSSATPQQALASRLDSLAERYDRLSEAGKRAAKAAGEAAKAAVAAAQDQTASPTARTNARQALDVAETTVISQERRDNVRDIFGSSRSSIDTYIARVEVLERRYQEMGKQERLAIESQRAALKLAAENAASTGQDTEFTKLRKEAEAFEAALNRINEARGQATATQFGPELPPGFGGLSDAGLGPALDDPQRQLEQLRSGIGSLKGQIDTLPAGIRSQLIPAVKAAEDEFLRLAASPASTADEIEAAASAVNRLQTAATNASKFTTTLSKSFDDSRVLVFSARLEALRGILVNAGAVAGTEAARKFEVLRESILRAVASGDFNSVIGDLNRLEKEAIEAAAAFSGVSNKNVQAKLTRAGDIGRAGVDKFSLALNQAAFAIDDFFSSTGGIEFKLRAVSNNITQLAFILGGTTGLFVGLGAVIGGQLAVAIAKYAFGLDDAKRRQEALKAQADALNATLDRQKSLVEELASAYRDLGRDIKQATLSPQGARFEQRQEREREVRQQQADRRREQVAGIIPAVAANRGRRQQFEAQINELPLGAERAAAQRRADRLRAQEDQVVARVERAAAARVGQNQAGLQDRRDFFQNRLESLQRDRARVVRDSGERDPRIAVFDRQINEAGEQLAEFTIALQRINDEAISTAFQFSGPLQDAIQRAQERLSSAFGDQRAPQQDTLDRAGRALGDLPGRITNENLSPAGTRQAIRDIEALARPAIEAANRLSDFATALTAAQESARRADEEARQRVQDLQSEVSRNPNDRALQAQLRAAQAGAAELAQRRQAVERDVKRGFGEAGLGPQANQTRQQQVRTDSDAASRFAEDLKRQGDLIARGFDIARPALEEFGRQLEQDLTALGEAAKADRQNAAQIIKDGRRNLAEQAAPMLVEMAKSVQNAVIAGPSRAALNASDVTTSQGQQELNRLLRGDDPAREADFVEMKNQTQKLTSIDAGIQKLVNQIGVAQ